MISVYQIVQNVSSDWTFLIVKKNIDTDLPTLGSSRWDDWTVVRNSSKLGNNNIAEFIIHKSIILQQGTFGLKLE